MLKMESLTLIALYALCFVLFHYGHCETNNLEACVFMCGLLTTISPIIHKCHCKTEDRRTYVPNSNTILALHSIVDMTILPVPNASCVVMCSKISWCNTNTYFNGGTCLLSANKHEGGQHLSETTTMLPSSVSQRQASTITTTMLPSSVSQRQASTVTTTMLPSSVSQRQASTVTTTMLPSSVSQRQASTVTTPGKSCEKMCRIKNGECFEGKCVCKLGFVYQPDDGEGECLKTCKLYAKEFTVLPTSSCKRESEYWSAEYRNTGVAGCKKKCTQLHDFTFCKAFRVEDNTCYLLGRPKPHEWPRGKWKTGGCDFYIRNCEKVPVDTCGDCGENRRCEGGRCACRYGYSLISGTDRCIEECRLRTDEFTLQSTRICKDVFANYFKKMNLETCKAECKDLLWSECWSLQMYKGSCYILDKERLSISDEEKPWEDWNKCSHYQRKCRGCDADCVGPNYVCIDGQCDCNLGYHPNTDGECVAECWSYTEEFTYNNYDRPNCCEAFTLYKYAHTTRKECEKRCLNAPFPCGAYQIKDGTCYKFKWTPEMVEKKNWKTKGKCKYYVRRCRPREIECRTECKEPSQVCENGKCICNIGYHQTTDNQCVPYCTRHSNTFTEQPAGVCFKKNVKKLEGLSHSECKAACVMSSFKCDGFDMIWDTCYLTEKTFPLFGTYTDCQHYSRDCKHRANPCLYCPENSRCVNQQCVCDYNYHMVPGSGSCVKHCSELGRDFSAYTVTWCPHLYRKITYSNSDKPRDCKMDCIYETDFDCKAYYKEDNGTVCYLSTGDPRAVNEGSVWKKHNCVYYIRNCEPNCEKGYSLILNKNICVWRCKEYTSEFQLQSNGMCLSKYHKSYENTDLDACREICQKTWDVLCDSFELYQGRCYIIQVMKKGEWDIWDGCKHYQQTCIA